MIRWKIKKVLLAGNFARKDVADGAALLRSHLVRAHMRVRVLEGAGTEKMPLVDEDADLVVALGGDGTTLSVIRRLGSNAIPVMGINFGHLGFLTAFRSNELEQAARAIATGGLRISRRMRLMLEVNAETQLYCGAPLYALNDVVVERATGNTAWVMLEDQGEETVFGGDGLIVSTPTGTTAYTKSAGGPIIDPMARSIAITPICPLELTARPVIYEGRRPVVLRMHPRSAQVRIVVDGKELLVKPRVGDAIVIRRATPALLALPRGWSYMRVLRERLGWNAPYAK